MKRTSRMSAKSGWKQPDGQQLPGLSSIPHTTDNVSVVSGISAIGGTNSYQIGPNETSTKDLIRQKDLLDKLE